jgi:hypothetical protein
MVVDLQGFMGRGRVRVLGQAGWAMAALLVFLALGLLALGLLAAWLLILPY